MVYFLRWFLRLKRTSSWDRGGGGWGGLVGRDERGRFGREWVFGLEAEAGFGIWSLLQMSE